jgi:peptidoglycan-associated lipoprotein
MNNKVVNAIFVICLSILFFGCSTKREVVSFDNKKAQQITPKIVDDNVSDAKLIKTIPSDEIVSSVTQGDNGISKIVDEKYNTTSSKINNEEITLKSIHFDFDAFILTEENLMFSTENSKKINDAYVKNTTFKVKLEGNCDEWGSDEYNYALGLKRAVAVKNDLVKKGIVEDKIVMVSYGESNPICKDQTAQCWLKNRRVDHYLVP